MPRKSLSLDEYITRGNRHQMTLLGDVPRTASMPTRWRCNVCGRVLEKSLNAIQYHSACVCRTSMTLKANDYKSLAYQLGIEWLGHYPENNKVRVEWVGRSGTVFMASYSELGYGFIPSRLKVLIDG